MRKEDRNMRIRSGRPKGQIAIIMAIAMPVLVGALGLCCDVLVMYFQWQNLQKATDAAVLAGANQLPGYPADALTLAQSWANKNGINSSEIVSTTVASDDQSISMTVNRTVPHYFARIFGIKSALITVAATAGVLGSTTAQNLVPIGIQCTAMPCFTPDPTKPVTLQVLKGTQISPGNWGPLALGASGGNTYRNNIQQGYSGAVSTGDMVTTQTGNMVGPTDQGFASRISAGQTSFPSSSPTEPTFGDPRIIELPMVDFTAANGNSHVPVIGFGLFFLQSSNGGVVTGYFIKMAGYGFKPNPNVADNGNYSFPVLLK
jgi:Flp pilus assembly protein TadG